MPFLAARTQLPAEIALLGVPFDATSTFRRGSAHGPDAIRWASESIETYSPILRAALDDVAFADLGNVELPDATAESLVAATEAAVRAAGSAIPILLGGEHTITLGGVRGVLAGHPDLAVIQLDAHTDLRDRYEGQTVSHATVMRRITDLIGAGRIVQLGVRAGTAEEFAFAAGAVKHHSRGLDVPPDVWTWLSGRPAYVTVDIDVLDPADAPGTGNPEYEGISARDLLAWVRRLSQLHVVGLDLVEVAPPFDPSGRTAVLAATILREAILAIALGKTRAAG